MIFLQRSRWERVLLVRFRGVALEISGPLARFLHLGTYCFMSRSAIADFPEGATQFCTRVVNISACCIVQDPAARKLPGSGDHTLASELQLVLQTVLVFLDPVELFTNLASHREQNVTLFTFKRHFLHSLLEDLIFLYQSVQGLHGVLLKSGALVLASAFFLYVALRLPFRLLKSRCSPTALIVLFQHLSRLQVRSCSLWVSAQLPQHLSYRRSPDLGHDPPSLHLHCSWQSRATCPHPTD